MTRRTTLTASLLVIVVAAIGAVLLSAARPDPPQKSRSARGVVVETMKAERREHSLDVNASGVVTPARLVKLQSQVTGRVEWLHERLAPGTLLKRGQLLYRVDAKDYRVALQRAEAELRVANSSLELELGSQRIAEQELQVLRQSARREPASGTFEFTFDESLVLRQPQLEAARSRVDMAAANVAGARLALSRTEYSAPFDGVVLESTAEIGQLVTAQTQLALIAGTEQAWIRLSLAQDSLPFIALPGEDGSNGATVVVSQTVAGEEIERTGVVLRLLSSLEESSRMAQLLVVIDDPLALRQSSSGTGEETPTRRVAPLLLNSYVQVEIQGQAQRTLVSVPRQAIREGDKVYVAADGRLSIRDLDVVWQAPEHVLVEHAVRDGEDIILSPLSGAIEGMQIRAVGLEPPSPLGRLAPKRSLGE